MTRAAVLLAAVALVAALAGCAPDAAGGTQRVEVDGEITAFTSAAGGTGYLLDVPEQGLLPLELGDQRPPLGATGVVIEVPGSVDLPGDDAGQFASLEELAEETGESLVVVAFLP